MFRSFNAVFSIMILTLVLNSCGLHIEKRVHRKGYFIQFNRKPISKNQTVETQKEFVSNEQNSNSAELSLVSEVPLNENINGSDTILIDQPSSKSNENPEQLFTKSLKKSTSSQLGKKLKNLSRSSPNSKSNSHHKLISNQKNSDLGRRIGIVLGIIALCIAGLVLLAAFAFSMASSELWILLLLGLGILAVLTLIVLLILQWN